jgi:hypothetical protein
MRRMDLSKFGFAVLAAMIAGGAGSSAFAQDAQSTQPDQPSVADAARAARKDKDKDKAAATKTVITEDSISSVAAAPAKANVAGASGATGSAAGASSAAASGPGAGNSSLDEAWARMQATEASLDALEPLGKSEVAVTVLHGNTTDFPGRADWEEQLFAAKTAYVARSRQLIAAMKQTLLGMASLQSGDQGKVAPNDPRITNLARKSAQLMQLAARTETDFQSVVSQGRSLAAAAR